MKWLRREWAVAEMDRDRQRSTSVGVVMDRPRIKIGTDDRFLLALFVAMLLIGCVAQGPSDVKKKSAKKPAGQATLSDAAFEAFQSRDIVRAKKLRAMKGTKYDVKRLTAIEQAGAEASRETWQPVADSLAKRLDGISQTDQAAFDAVLEELAIAAERAGK